MTAPAVSHVELEATALLIAVEETAGGDLLAALAILCARVRVEDLAGETFDLALQRAVRELFSRPQLLDYGAARPAARGDRAVPTKPLEGRAVI